MLSFTQTLKRSKYNSRRYLETAFAKFAYIIPKEFHWARTPEVKFSLRKRLLHSGYQLSVCYLPYSENVWIPVCNPSTVDEATVIMTNWRI